jgi:hypothetical protein
LENLNMERQLWWIYAVCAGLAWGTYVPFVVQGINGLPTLAGKPQALGSFLCVGVAYFLIAVLFPAGMFATGEPMPRWNAYGISMATLAGVAGALGALCVILASRSAVSAYGPAQGANYRVYIAPIIFALAPVLNALISTVWHPSPAEGPFHFGLEHVPGWKLWVGVVLTGIGAALVLYSKEEAERAAPRVAPPAAVAPAPEPPSETK